MKAKVTLLMQIVTGSTPWSIEQQRIGGWSESVYYDGPSVSDLYAKVIGPTGTGSPSLCSARAGMLPTQGRIVGQRFQFLDPLGPSKSLSQGFSGGSSQSTDIPQMALLCKVPATDSPNIRNLILRGIPDSQVQYGEYVPDSTYRAAVTRYFTAFSMFRFRANVPANLDQTIISISSGGVAYLYFGPLTVSAGSIIKLNRVVLANGSTFSGQVVVESVGPGANELKIKDWTMGATTGGKWNIPNTAYPAVDASNITISRIITRKVGRPSVGYVGRASANSR